MAGRRKRSKRYAAEEPPRGPRGRAPRRKGGPANTPFLIGGGVAFAVIALALAVFALSSGDTPPPPARHGKRVRTRRRNPYATPRVKPFKGDPVKRARSLQRQRDMTDDPGRKHRLNLELVRLKRSMTVQELDALEK